MVERVKLSRDTQTPSAGLKEGSVRSGKSSTRRTRKIGLAAKATRRKTFTSEDGDNHKPGPGRPRGSVNRVNAIIKEAALLAVEQTGENGRGKGGVVGFFRRVCRKDPRAMVGLLQKIMPTQVTLEGDIEHTHNHYSTAADIRKELAARGLAVDEIFERPMKVIEHRKDELKEPPKEKSAIEKALVKV
jgi:hypothetical protein